MSDDEFLDLAGRAHQAQAWVASLLLMNVPTDPAEAAKQRANYEDAMAKHEHLGAQLRKAARDRLKAS